MKTKCTKKLQKRVESSYGNLNKNEKLFLNHVVNHCNEVGIKCDLRNTKSVLLNRTDRCSGYFDSENKVMVVAMKHKIAMSILVHEYCHITQWLDDKKNWDVMGQSLEKLDVWLSGGRVYNIAKHLAVARDIELDNERRSVKMIKKWNLNIDISKYIMQANAYVQFYNWMYYTRRWCKEAPYLNKVILNVVSKKFNMNYDTMSTKVYNAFLEANI